MDANEILARLANAACWNPTRDNPDPPNTDRNSWRKIQIELCCRQFELEVRLRGDVWEYGNLTEK